MRFAYCTAAALLAGGLLLTSAVPASAQAQGSGPPVQGEQKEPEPPQGEKKADEPTAEQQAAARALEEIEQYKQAAKELSITAGSAECVWTGRRIESLLWRDDVDTAKRYIDLYDRFGCSAEHLKLAFRCLIRQGPLDPKATDRLAARVHACWIDPDGATTAASQTTPPSTTPTGTPAKSGTIPN